MHSLSHDWNLALIWQSLWIVGRDLESARFNVKRYDKRNGNLVANLFPTRKTTFRTCGNHIWPIFRKKKINTFHSSAWTITHFAHWWIIRKNIPDTINRLKKLYPLLIDTTFISSDIELLNYSQVLISDETMISSPLARLFWRHFIMNNYILNTIIKWIASIYTRLLIIFTLIYRCIHIISSYQLI